MAPALHPSGELWFVESWQGGRADLVPSTRQSLCRSGDTSRRCSRICEPLRLNIPGHLIPQVPFPEAAIWGKRWLLLPVPSGFARRMRCAFRGTLPFQKASWKKTLGILKSLGREEASRRRCRAEATAQGSHWQGPGLPCCWAGFRSANEAACAALAA